MPKIKCDCDNIIYLGDIPSPNQWMIISDKDYDELTDKNSDFAGKIDTELVYSKMQIVVKCSKCERLHIFWQGYDKPQTVYSKQR